MLCPLAGLLLLAVLVTSQPLSAGERHQVVIVGAGVSGFAAAATLLQNNVTDLLVLEASDRIGGRIHTVQFGGVALDEGAEYVEGEKDNAVFELVGSSGLLALNETVQIDPDKFLFANTSGHLLNSTLPSLLIDVWYDRKRDRSMEHFNGSVEDYMLPRLNKMLASYNVTTKLSEALRHLLLQLEREESAADDLSEQGAWGSSSYRKPDGYPWIEWQTGGYDVIFDYLSRKLPNPDEELPVKNKTLFNKLVTGVEMKEGHVEVTCGDGSSYIADHVIMTPSLGVLKKHAAAMFHPPLPPNKTAAIEALGFGTVDKVVLLFPTRWWPNDTFYLAPLYSEQELKDFQKNSTHGYWTSYTSGFYPVMKNERMLCAWFAGEPSRTVENLTEDQVIDGLMELLQRFLGDKFDIPRAEAILRSQWHNNPFTLGAYSYRTVASDLKNITNDDLASPVLEGEGDKPVILFAGEATHPHYWSTVHGALDSGRREALRLLPHLKSESSSSTPQ